MRTSRALTALACLALAACSNPTPASSTASSGAGSTGSGASSSSAAAGSTSTAGSASSSSGATTGTGSTTGGSTTGGSSSTGGAHLTLGAPIDALVGINAFIDDPQDKLQAFGTVREYHEWSWNDGSDQSPHPAYPNNVLKFSLWSGFWDFDAYYTALSNAGVTVFPCVQGSVDYLSSAQPPVQRGADPTAAASYAAHADFMFQLAARYGATAVPDAKLKLASGQVRASGMNVLHYLEDANEPDNDWSTSDGSYVFSPAADAAMASADYDGDQGRLGDTFGVKTADPHMKMVLGGLAEGDAHGLTYLDGIRAWAQAHRGGSFPADVLNFHTYCFGPDPFGTAHPRPAQSPEDCGLSADLAQLVAYRDAHLPGKEVWLTEFGYDTDPNSRLRAPAIGSASAETVQAQWLVRSILAIAEAGIDRATVFVSRDSCEAGESGCDSTIQFATSGVLTEKSAFTPKPAYFYLATFRHALAGLRFAGTRQSGSAGVRVDAFADSSGRGAYVVWSPTSAGATVPGYALSVPGATQATQVSLADQSLTGSSSALDIASAHVRVDVSETPLMVQVDRVE